MIPAEAVEVATKAFRDAHEAAYKAWMEQPGAETPNFESYMRAALEAVAPYMLAPIRALMEDPEHYDTQGPSAGYVSVDNLRAAIGINEGEK